jgi:desulfoferrodoxin-like iron-binding protein
MAVTKLGEKFKCNICGNVVEVINVGGGTLVCCGKEMQPAKDIGSALLERREENEDEIEKEELEEMVEELKGEPEEEVEKEW